MRDCGEGAGKGGAGRDCAVHRGCAVHGVGAGPRGGRGRDRARVDGPGLHRVARAAAIRAASCGALARRLPLRFGRHRREAAREDHQHGGERGDRGRDGDLELLDAEDGGLGHRRGAVHRHRHRQARTDHRAACRRRAQIGLNVRLGGVRSVRVREKELGLDDHRALEEANEDGIQRGPGGDRSDQVFLDLRPLRWQQRLRVAIACHLDVDDGLGGFDNRIRLYRDHSRAFFRRSSQFGNDVVAQLLVARVACASFDELNELVTRDAVAFPGGVGARAYGGHVIRGDDVVQFHQIDEGLELAALQLPIVIAAPDIDAVVGLIEVKVVDFLRIGSCIRGKRAGGLRGHRRTLSSAASQCGVGTAGAPVAAHAATVRMRSRVAILLRLPGDTAPYPRYRYRGYGVTRYIRLR